MKRTSLFLLVLGAAACDGGTYEGIAVGNPGQGMTVQLENGADLAHVEGRMRLSELRTVSCEGAKTRLTGDAELTLKDATTLPVPLGPLCRVELELSEPIELWGTFDNGLAFDLTLDVPDIVVATDTAFTDVTPLLLLLGPGPWLTSTTVGARTMPVSVTPDHAMHDTYVAYIGRQSLLCEDHDDDGLREEGDSILARGDAWDDPDIPEPGW